MSNPNNVSLNINHELEFIDGHALNIPTLSILTEDGDIHPSAPAPDICYIGQCFNKMFSGINAKVFSIFITKKVAIS